MSKCNKCGKFIPFDGCPTCPPQIVKCSKCGEPVIVEYMTDAQYESIIDDQAERVNLRDVINLGNITQR